MCMLKRKVGSFIKRGAATFRKASKGQYKQNSEAISDIRKELFGRENERADDKKKLLGDRRNIEDDVRRAFDKLAITSL